MQRKVPPLSILSTDRLKSVLCSALIGHPLDLTNDEVIALTAHALRSREATIPTSVHLVPEVVHPSRTVSAKVLPFPTNVLKSSKVPVE